MKNLLIAGALSFATMTAGCAQLQEGVDWLDAPKTQQAVATLRTVATALICDISAGSALAKSIEAQVGAHQGVTNEIDVASTAVCAALQGRLVPGVTEANVTAVAAVSP